jgi:hypothetical protein
MDSEMNSSPSSSPPALPSVDTTDRSLSREEYLAILEVKAACPATKVFANNLVAILFRAMCPTQRYRSWRYPSAGKASNTSKLTSGYLVLR